MYVCPRVRLPVIDRLPGTAPPVCIDMISRCLKIDESNDYSNAPLPRLNLFMYDISLPFPIISKEHFV